jgi:hypothetical protein
MEGRFDNYEDPPIGVEEMEAKYGTIGTLIAIAAIALFAVGCGGGGGGGGGGGSTTEASAEFLKNAGNERNTVEFGEESDEEEREAASGVLEENMQARAAGDWAKQCASLSKSAIEEIETENGKKGCVKVVEFLAEVPEEQKTQSVRENPLTGPVAALRVKGNEGYALFHGTKNTDYAMKMEKEDGQWKVSGITISVEFPPK